MRGKDMTFINIKAPCHDCEDRVLGCHDTCERFQAYRQKMAEVKENRAEALRYTKPNAITRTKPKGAKP